MKNIFFIKNIISPNREETFDNYGIDIDSSEDSPPKMKSHKRSILNLRGEFKNIQHPTFNGIIKSREEAETWHIDMGKYMQICGYSSCMKERIAIYNLHSKASIWWDDLKLKKDIKEKNIRWNTFKKLFK